MWSRGKQGKESKMRCRNEEVWKKQESYIRLKIQKLLVSLKDLRVMDFPIMLCPCPWGTQHVSHSHHSVGLSAPHGCCALFCISLTLHGPNTYWYLIDVCSLIITKALIVLTRLKWWLIFMFHYIEWTFSGRGGIWKIIFFSFFFFFIFCSLIQKIGVYMDAQAGLFIDSRGSQSP